MTKLGKWDPAPGVLRGDTLGEREMTAGADDAASRLRTPAGKVTVPRPPRALISRPRCTDELAAAVAAHRLVVVSAPAGFGKTTLLTQWAGATDQVVAWASLDALDDDPGRLTRVLADAVAGAVPEAGEDLSVLDDRAVTTVARRVDALVAALERLPSGPVVVLDDVHQLSARTARQVLGPLLRYPGPRFVLAGRYDTALPVNRMRLTGELGELRERTLAFTPAEVTALVGALGGVPEEGATRALWEVTKGWPVAVRLAIAADVLGSSSRPLEHLRDRDVPITGYLVEEVIGALPEELADFVLRASVAGVVDPALAEDLVPGGARMLDECATRGLFLTEIGDSDEGGAVYQWHALVAAHASAVLARRDPVAAQVSHRVVAAHLGASDPAAAIQHALDGHAPDLAATILGERWPDLLVRGDVGLVRRLRAALPAPHRHDPDVLLALSAAQAFDPEEDDGVDAGIAGDRSAAVGTLVRTFMAADRPPAEIAVPRGIAVLDGGGLDEATRALGLYLVGRAQLQWFGTPGDGIAHLAHGAALAAERGWVALELACRAEEALALAHRGDVAAAWMRGQAVLATAGAHGWQGAGIVSSAHVACGLAAYWRDELDAARQHLGAAIESASRTRPEVAVYAAGIAALVCLALGDAAGLTRAREVTDAPWTEGPEPEYLTAFRAFLSAVQLDAEDRPHEALALVDERAVVFADPLALVWQSDLRRRCGDPTGAWRSLRAARAVPDGVGRATSTPRCVAADAVEALLLAEAADDDAGLAAAHDALEAALTAAAPHGVVRPLRDRAASLHPLLSAHLEWGSAHEALIARLLVAEHAAPPPRASAWELTARERDVLACLRSSLTSDEIAGSLFLSINTVKTHMRAIYRKLGVDGRRSAVRVAVQRGLL